MTDDEFKDEYVSLASKLRNLVVSFDSDVHTINLHLSEETFDKDKFLINLYCYRYKEKSGKRYIKPDCIYDSYVFSDK